MPYTPLSDLKNMPATQILSRDARLTFNNFSPALPFIQNTMYAMGSPPFIGLDFAVNNQNGTTTAVIFLDGEELDVPPLGIESLSDSPFSEMRLTAGANLFIRIAGMTIDLWKTVNPRSAFNVPLKPRRLF